MRASRMQVLPATAPHRLLCLAARSSHRVSLDARPLQTLAGLPEPVPGEPLPVRQHAPRQAQQHDGAVPPAQPGEHPPPLPSGASCHACIPAGAPGSRPVYCWVATGRGRAQVFRSECQGRRWCHRPSHAMYRACMAAEFATLLERALLCCPARTRRPSPAPATTAAPRSSRGRASAARSARTLTCAPTASTPSATRMRSWYVCPALPGHIPQLAGLVHPAWGLAWPLQGCYYLPPGECTRFLQRTASACTVSLPAHCKPYPTHAC